MMRFPRYLVVLSLALAGEGCSFLGSLDRIHNQERPFDFHLTWDRVEHVGPENPATPGFDADGNKIPTAETLATYTFPPITAGIDAAVYRRAKVTPTVGVALVDVKVPYVRWLDVQAFAGYQQVGVGLYKRFTSIFEVCAGVGCVWDFDVHRPVPVVGVTITKF